MNKEKYKPNLSSLLFLFIFLFIPDITFRMPDLFWNSIFIIQSSLKYVVIGYLFSSIFYRNKFLEEKQAFFNGNRLFTILFTLTSFSNDYSFIIHN